MLREEVAFIDEHGWAGALYNELLTDGAYIVYALHPRVRPVMDAHLGGGERALAEYEATKASSAKLAAYLAKYDVKLALVNADGWMADLLQDDPAWKEQLHAARRRLFLRK
jgi:hypothetical protein